MVSYRLITGGLILAQLAVIVPIAYSFVRIERHPLDVNGRLDHLSDVVQRVVNQDCAARSQTACKAAQDRDVWEWSSSLVIGMKLLVEETLAPLDVWSRVVDDLTTFIKPIADEFALPVTVESSVIFHANVDLLRRETSKGQITAETIKKSLHRIIDEAEVGGSGDRDEREVNLIAWSLKGNSSQSEYVSYRIPSWGIVSFAIPLQLNRDIFEQYVREVIFGLKGRGQNAAETNLARRRALGQGLSSVLQKLRATKILAENLPRLPVPLSVSTPFEQALDLVEIALGETVEAAMALKCVRKASELANMISSDPSLIPELYVSDENLFAIFAPLIFPTLLPLLMGVGREAKLAIAARKRILNNTNK